VFAEAGIELDDGVDRAAGGTTYRVDVPGGRLDVIWTEEGRIVLTGPAVIVAQGQWQG